MGILFATIILTISGVIHNNNLSEEKIIKEAKKLGMIMPEETESESGGLWNKDETTENLVADSETENPASNSEIEETDELKKDGEKVVGDDGVTYIIIYVYPGDTARMVSERLYENDLVDDAEAFRKYLGQTGRAGSLNVGGFMVPLDATYEQIFNVLMGR